MPSVGNAYTQRLCTKRHGVYFVDSLSLEMIMTLGGSGYDNALVDRGINASVFAAEGLTDAQSLATSAMRSSWSSESPCCPELSFAKSEVPIPELSDSLSTFTSTDEGDPTSMRAVNGCLSSGSPSRSSEETLFENSYDSERHSQCQEPKISVRQSISDQLNLSIQEAYEEMELSNAEASDPLVCPRHGCRETVRNVFALGRHLHLHDIPQRQVLIPPRSILSKGVDKWAHHCPMKDLRSRDASPTPSFLENLGHIILNILT